MKNINGDKRRNGRKNETKKQRNKNRKLRNIKQQTYTEQETYKDRHTNRERKRGKERERERKKKRKRGIYRNNKVGTRKEWKMIKGIDFNQRISTFQEKTYHHKSNQGNMSKENKQYTRNIILHVPLCYTFF